jgi:hypothetical protein
MSNIDPLGELIAIPPGTRLYGIELFPDRTRVWIAVKKTRQYHREWQGTYIDVMHSGEVTRVTNDDVYDVEQTMLIRKAK